MAKDVERQAPVKKQVQEPPQIADIRENIAEPHLAIGGNPPRITQKNVAEFKVKPAGECVFSASHTTSTRACSKVSSGLIEIAGQKGFDGFGLHLAAQEFIVNAAQNGCGWDARKNVNVGWNMGDEDARLTTRNPLENLFNPTQHLLREGKQIEREKKEDENPHLGTQIIIWYADRIDYEWALSGGDKIRLTMNKKPGTDLKDYLARKGATEKRWRWVRGDEEKPLRNFEAAQERMKDAGLKTETVTVTATFKKP